MQQLFLRVSHTYSSRLINMWKGVYHMYRVSIHKVCVICFLYFLFTCNKRISAVLKNICTEQERINICQYVVLLPNLKIVFCPPVQIKHITEWRVLTLYSRQASFHKVKLTIWRRVFYLKNIRIVI